MDRLAQTQEFELRLRHGRHSQDEPSEERYQMIRFCQKLSVADLSEAVWQDNRHVHEKTLIETLFQSQSLECDMDGPVYLVENALLS